MKKLLFLAAAMLLSLGIQAQSNLALNKAAYASSVSDENDQLTADKAVDGDANSKWASNYDTKGLLGWGDDEKAAQWFYVDLGEETDVNTVKISWDNQAAHKFDIRLSSVAPASNDEVKTTGTVALADQVGTDWQENTYQLSTTSVKARYIIIDLKERGPWGYGIRELTVQNIDYSAVELTSFTATPVFFPTAEATTFTLTSLDQYNNAIDVDYTVGGAAFANPFTATVEGAVTITATDASANALNATVYALDAANAPATPADVVLIYGEGTTNEWYCDWNGAAHQDNTFTLGTLPVKSFTDLRCAFVANPALNAWDADVNPTAEGYAKLHFSIYSPADGVQINIDFERTKTIGDHHLFTLHQGWNDVEVDLAGETLIHTIAIKNSKDGGNPDRDTEGPSLAVANIYYTKAGANPEAGKIVSLDVAPQIVATGVATDLTLTPRDNLGAAITEGVSFSADGLTGTSLTAATDGPQTITGSTNSGAETATAQVYAISPLTRQTADANTIVLFGGDAAAAKVGFDAGSQDWDGGFHHLDNIQFADGTEAFHADKVRKFYLTNPGLSAADLVGVSKLHLDLFSNVSKSGVVVNLEGINAQTTVDVVAGEWTSVEVPFTGGTAATSWIWVKFAETADPAEAEIVVDNVYFSKEKVAVPFDLKVVDGVATATGDLTAADVAALNAADAMWIDLTGITSLEDGLTIEPLHKNALVRVPGTVEANQAVIDPAFSALANVRNAVVGATWIFPLAQIQIDANDGEPLWNGEGGLQPFISTGSRGYKITRTINGYATACYPTIFTAPADVEVYEFTGVATDGSIVLTKKDNRELITGVPYVLNAANVEVVAEGTGDLNLNNAPGNVVVGTATFQGTYLPVETDGSQYVLSSDSKVSAATGTTIDPLRAYFLGVDEQTVTGIDSINSSTRQSVNASTVYTLDGRQVEGKLSQGVYIIGGKKVVVK